MIPKTMTISLILMLFLNNIIAEQLSGSVKYDGNAMPKIPKPPPPPPNSGNLVIFFPDVKRRFARMTEKKYH